MIAPLLLAFFLLCGLPCEAQPPGQLEAGGRTWRLAHSEVSLQDDQHTVSIHYTAAATGAPREQGPWMSLWAMYRPQVGRIPSGNLPGMSGLFDASAWKSDEVLRRKGGVERLEPRRYIEAWRGGVEYSIWPQEAQPIPFLTALFDGGELGSVTGLYVASGRFEQDGARETWPIPAPDLWQLTGRREGAVRTLQLRSGNPVKLAVRVEATRFIYGVRGCRRESPGAATGATVVVRAPAGNLEAVTDRDGWVGVVVEQPLPIEPDRRKVPARPSADGLVLELWEAPAPVSVYATPRRLKGDSAVLGCGFVLEPGRLRPPPGASTPRAVGIPAAGSPGRPTAAGAPGRTE